MKAIDLLKTLENLEKPIFTIADISKITGKNAAYVRLYMHRLKKQGRIEEIEKGKYALNETDPLCIAPNVTFPAYVSFLSALAYYGLTTQLPRTIFVACAKSKKEIKKEGYTIKFVKLKRIFGYRREKYHGKIIFIGDLEKVIVDSLFLPQYCPLDETFNAIMEGEYDTSKLIEYAVKMDSAVVLKRLGYLLDLKGTDVHEKLKGKISKRYDPVNPLLPKTGDKNKKWRLILNENFEA